MPTRTTRAAGWLALKDYKEEEEEEYLFAQKPIKERGFLSSSFAVKRGQFYLQFQKFHLDFVLESLILNLSLIPLSSDLQNPLLHPAICVLVIVSGSDLRTLSCILLSLFSVLKRNLEKMLCKMVSVPRKKKSGCVPVYLNVYDLTPINGYAYWLGLGIYHSGVQVHGVEYGFGAHDHSTTGVFEVEPKQCPGFTFRKSILVGRTDLGPKEVRAFMEKLAEEYCGNTYHLITRNCNHFCDDVCIRLTCKPIPSWVNRLARLGLFCNCVLPAELNETKVRQVRREDKIQEDIQKKLRSRSSRLPSSSSLSSSSSSLADSLQPSLSSSANRSRRQNRCLPPPVFREHSGFNY